MRFPQHLANKTIAVSGLATGDNPQPGVPVIRSLREAGFTGRIVGFAYDSLEAGIYVDNLADDIFLMPYPSSGIDAFLARMQQIVAQAPIDIVIPTLDSELLTYIRLQSKLEALGIHTFLPTEDQFRLRDKTCLARCFDDEDIRVPHTLMLNEVGQLAREDIRYPVFVKGALYEAYRANTIAEAAALFHRISAKWGLPILVQEFVQGEEFNICCVGDGKGNLLGMVPQRKLIITDKGKGFGGVVVDNPQLNEFTRKVVASLRWRGPCELEVIQRADGVFFLIEMNPRFPAWVRLATGAGQNLPAMVACLALGEDVEPFTTCHAGTMFIRHSEDIIANIQTMGQLSTQYMLRKEKR
ncbi:MAG: ATP-grasp domain-containing protein [Candidatus Cloacimonetes bacterium]|nr:ATP-grasp domain-containing protein [Candidatus Cloacimonadota bacterium]